MDLDQLQREQKEWSDHNFGDHPSYWPLLGIVEEVGELAHAYLKHEQGIRIGEDHIEKAKDAVGDIVIFIAGFCNSMGFDLQTIVEETWEDVKKRDWKTDPLNANRPEGGA